MLQPTLATTFLLTAAESFAVPIGTGTKNASPRMTLRRTAMKERDDFMGVMMRLYQRWTCLRLTVCPCGRFVRRTSSGPRRSMWFLEETIGFD